MTVCTISISLVEIVDSALFALAQLLCTVTISHLFAISW